MDAVRSNTAPIGRVEPTRILVHDFGGYPFILQLSRELACRGHTVLHISAGGFRKPKGPMEHREDDPPGLTLATLTLDEPLRPSGWRRIAQERRYARLLGQRIDAFRPEVVISANSPLYVHLAASRWTHANGAAYILWLQDLHSVAIARITGRRVRLLGSLIGGWFARLERRLLREADGVVAISSTYLPAIAELGVSMEKVEVIENWAPLEEGEPPSKANQWSRAHGLHDRPVLMYAGTLALKHDPGLLLDLARGVPEATLAVVSEGPGAAWLQANSGGVENLRVLPFQPYGQVAEMLASADLLLAILEPDASTFSVPSKVLTYFAAGRTILAAMPGDNPAARAIEQTGAGTVVDAGDAARLVAAAHALLANPKRRREAGEAARAYALANFAIAPIADRFEAVIAARQRRSA